MLSDKLTNLSAMQTAMDAMPLPDGEPFPGETLRADGWQYGDLPKLSREYFDKFLAIVGDENLRWLSFATYGPDSMRGQYFISPRGKENLMQYFAQSQSVPAPQAMK